MFTSEKTHNRTVGCVDIKDSQEEKNKIKIFIVDDHPIVRQGLAMLINQEEDLVVCGEAEDANRALKDIGALKPDMAIVDISLAGTSGIELISQIKERHPGLPVLVLSMHDEHLYAERILRAGALGYIKKQEATGKMLDAIRKVLAGERYLSKEIMEEMLCKFITGKPETSGSPVDRLSNRELEVFQLVGHGHTKRQIAEKLHLSVKTIDTYFAHIKEKLDLKNAAELLQNAIRWSKDAEQRGSA